MPNLMYVDIDGKPNSTVMSSRTSRWLEQTIAVALQQKKDRPYRPCKCFACTFDVLVKGR